MLKRKDLIGFILFSGGLLWSCKKASVSPQDDAPATGTRTQLTLDSVYLYARQTYLWNEGLPTYTAFNPRQYVSESTDLDNFKKELYSLSQLQVNALTGLPYESPVGPGSPKYSFIQQGNTQANSVASVNVQGNGNDLGLQLAQLSDEIYIQYVYPQSPADKAGLKRGQLVKTINGEPVQASYTLYVLDEVAITLGVVNENGEVNNVSLTSAVYDTDPVFKYGVITQNSRKIAYIALSQFYPLSTSRSALNEAYAAFASAQCTDIVIDLRYNGGGYVETAEYVANLTSTSAMAGKVMYTEHFNTQLQQGRATILKNQPYTDANGQPVYINGRRASMADVDFTVAGNTFKFNKAGSLQTIKNVFFIVSENTASASELLVNCLKPYFNVKLIGNTTYGKPVGFFGINIDRYSLFIPNFQIMNAAGVGDYFSGFAPDIIADDDITHDFGDPQELRLKQALNVITESASTSVANQSVSFKVQALTVKQQFHIALGGPMLETRFKLKTTN